MKTHHLIWFSAVFLAGCYVRHWSRTGTGQFKRIGDILSKQ